MKGGQPSPKGSRFETGGRDSSSLASKEPGMQCGVTCADAVRGIAFYEKLSLCLIIKAVGALTLTEACAGLKGHERGIIPFLENISIPDKQEKHKDEYA